MTSNFPFYSFIGTFINLVCPWGQWLLIFSIQQISKTVYKSSINMFDLDESQSDNCRTRDLCSHSTKCSTIRPYLATNRVLCNCPDTFYSGNAGHYCNTKKIWNHTCHPFRAQLCLQLWIALLETNSCTKLYHSYKSSIRARYLATTRFYSNSWDCTS